MFKWVLITLPTAFFGTFWRILIRSKGFNKKGNHLAATIIANISGAIAVLLFLPFFKFSLPTDVKSWTLLILSGTIFSVGSFSILFGHTNAQIADASILTPLGNVYLLIASALFLNESISTLKIASTILIVVGCIITLYKGKALVVNKGVIAMFLFGLTMTISYIIDKSISSKFSSPLYIAMTYSIASLGLVPFLGKGKLAKLKQEFKLQKNVLVPTGISWAMFSFLLLVAYSYGDASQVIPFSRIFIVFVTLYSVLVFKETERRAQKIIGSLIVTAGAILIAYT